MAQPKVTTLLNKIKIITYFENLIVELYVLYTLNTYIKFCVNQILSTIRSISAYILCIILNYKNLQFKQYIDDIANDFQFSRNFASIERIRRKYNLMVDLSKFTFNKKILSKILA